MPALFAYLIALGLLFGAGYGALNWLAEPPAKMAAKANSKSKSQPSYQVQPHQVAEASPQASKSDDSSVAPKSSANDDEMASSSSDQQISPQAQPSVAMDDRATQPTAATPAAAGNEIRSANAEMRSDEAKPRKAELSVKPAVPADPPTSEPSSASSAPGAIDRTSRRPHSRQASGHVEKRRLEIMTLRTIEFPDGHRITQLIPFGGGESLPR
jgi:hypothetical protein